MSSKVSIAASRAPVEGVSWHAYRDALDEADQVHLDLWGAAAAQVSAEAGGTPAVVVVLPARAWWALIRDVAEARAQGADGHSTSPFASTEVRRVEQARWAQLASDRPAVAAALAREYARRIGVLRYAVSRALSDGADPLTIACAEALLDGGTFGMTPPPALRRETEGHATRVAEALRRAMGDEHAAWRWLLSARPPALAGRTPLEALREGEWTAVLDLLGQAGEGGVV